MIWRTLVLFSFLIQVACSTTSSTRVPLVVGTWYGSSLQPHTSPYPIHWVSEDSADGTFSMVTYEERPCGLRVFSREAGRWGMSNGIYTIITTQLNGNAVNSADRYLQDVYEVNSISRDKFTYRSITYGIEFEARRVQPGYKPPLTMCSSDSEGASVL